MTSCDFLTEWLDALLAAGGTGISEGYGGKQDGILEVRKTKTHLPPHMWLHG